MSLSRSPARKAPARSAHIVSHVNTRLRAPPWTDEQLEILRLRWRELTDVEMAQLLSQHGPERSVGGVTDKRRTLNLARPRGFDIAALRAAGGWPIIVGTPEECAERHYQALRRSLAQQGVA